MLTGFLTLAGTLLAILFYELKRHNTREDDPKTQIQQAKDENGKTVATGNDDDLNALLDARLNRVRPQNASSITGSPSGVNASK